MPDYTVHPHGGRWAVAEAGAGSPLEEHATREAAELAARHLADGGAVQVLDQDPTTLDGSAPPGGADRGEAGAGGGFDGMTDDEHVRSEQGGL